MNAASLRSEQAHKQSMPWAKRYGLALILAALFITSWAGQAWTGWHNYVQEQVTHGEHGISLWTYLSEWDFWESTLENWQSEFLQLLTFVVLAAFFYMMGSAESKDSDERIEAKLDELLKERT